MAIVISNLNNPQNGKHLFVDLRLDIQTQTNDITANRRTQQNDVATLTDMAALRIRIGNLISTLPGEMVLEPTYGCNLNQYLFEPVSRDRGYVIGRYIRGQIERFVPQVKLEKITVVSNTDLQKYDIEIIFSNRRIKQQDKTGIVIDRTSGTIQQI